MKIKKVINAVVFLGLLVMVVLTIAVFPTKGMALTGADICSSLKAGDYVTDTDGDGIPDYYECKGFTLADGATHAYGFTDTNRPAGGSMNIDPSIKDLFAIVNSSPSGSLLSIPGYPASLFQSISAPTVANSGGGLGVTVHPVTPQQVATGSDQSIAYQLTLSKDASGNYLFTQKATNTDELTDASYTLDCRKLGSASVMLGSTTLGVTPNTPGISSKVYANRLAAWIKAMCGGVCTKVTSCIDNATKYGKTATGGNLQDLINYYQKQNISHELGHMMCLSPDNTTLKHHYASNQAYTGYSVEGTGAGSIMEDHAFYTSTSTSIVFYVPGVFDASDPGMMRIAGTVCP